MLDAQYGLLLGSPFRYQNGKSGGSQSLDTDAPDKARTHQ